MNRRRVPERGKLRFPRGNSETERSLFFSRFWIYCAVAVIVLGVIIGDRGITLVGCLVGFAATVTWTWNRATLARIRYVRRLDADRVFPGDTVELRIKIVNDKPLPVPWVTIDEVMSDGLRLGDRANTPSGVPGRRIFQLRTRLGPYERVTWRIPVECPARGWHAIGPATIRAGDPLGFFSNRLEPSEINSIIVYPRVEPLPHLQLPSRHAVGDMRVPRQLYVDPLRVVGIRDYRPEDPFKAIHWKASARQGSLQVRIAEPTTTMHLAIFANIDTFNRYWEGIDISASERVIDLAASLAIWALDHRYSVSVASNGILAGSDQHLRVPARRGREQRLHVLEGLAKISPYSSMPFMASLKGGSSRLAPGSTVVIITSILPDGLSAFLQALIAAGQRAVLIPVGDCPVPAMRGLILRRVPEAIAASPDDVTTRVANG